MLVLLCALAHAEDAFVALHAPQADASSFLKSNWNKYNENYHPNYLLDGDASTAWVEGAEGVGAGEWVGWELSRVTAVHRAKLRVRNGYQKSENLLKANAAPKTISIELRAQGNVVWHQQATLQRAMGWQEVVLDPPKDVALDEVRLVVVDVHEGSTYADTCISDAELWIESDSKYNPGFEQAKHKHLGAWIADRQQAAAYFANQPQQYPFAASHFARTERTMTPEEAASLATELDAGLKAREALLTGEGTWQRVDGTAPRRPDGLGLDDDQLKWLSSERTLFEASSEWRSRSSGGPNEEWLQLDALSNARTRLGPDGELVEAAFHHHTVIEERSVEDKDKRWLVRFDGEGRATSFVGSWNGWEGECCDARQYEVVVDLHRDGAGQIDRVTERTRYTCTNCCECEEHGTSEGNVHVHHDEVTWTAASG